jgi:hypothetical protein
MFSALCSWLKSKLKEDNAQDRRRDARAALVRVFCGVLDGTLTARDRHIAPTLASNETTGAIAKQQGVPPARGSQLRRELAESWKCIVRLM